MCRINNLSNQSLNIEMKNINYLLDKSAFQTLSFEDADKAINNSSACSMKKG